MLGAEVQGRAGHPALAAGYRAWHKQGQALLCFLAGLEAAPACSLCPAVGFLQHPPVAVPADIDIAVQIGLSAGLVFVRGNLPGLVRTVVKICVKGEGACWVCLTDRCCVHLYDLPLGQQEQVQSQPHCMQICLAAPRASPCSQSGECEGLVWAQGLLCLGVAVLFGCLEEVSSLFLPSFLT